MPLSEYEQQMLRQREQALSADDPQLVSQLRNLGSSRPSNRRLAIGVIGVIVGLALIVTAVLVPLIPLGALGFAVMVATAGYALWPTSRRPRLATVNPDGTTGPARSGARTKGARRDSSFMQRMEDRWDRRRDDNWR